MNKTQAIAIAIGLGLVSYVFFGDVLLSFFNSPEESLTKMETNNFLKTTDVSIGQGSVAENGDLLTVHYVGKLVDGRVFDSSVDRNEPFTFTLGAGQVIRGWDEGMVGMKVGGKRELTIAPEYAYGARGVGTIPANATLMFEVELLSVNKR